MPAPLDLVFLKDYCSLDWTQWLTVGSYLNYLNVTPGFPSTKMPYQWTVSLGEHHYLSVVLKLVVVILHWM